VSRWATQRRIRHARRSFFFFFCVWLPSAFEMSVTTRGFTAPIHPVFGGLTARGGVMWKNLLTNAGKAVCGLDFPFPVDNYGTPFRCFGFFLWFFFCKLIPVGTMFPMVVLQAPRHESSNPVQFPITSQPLLWVVPFILGQVGCFLLIA